MAKKLANKGLGGVASLLLLILPAQANSQNSPAFFISIDGIVPSLVEKLVDAGALDAPQGLGWLYQHATVAKQASPIDNTLTAASHVSTITCTPPAKHGIIANHFIDQGKRVSGFNHPIKADTLWQAAQRAGKKVLSVAHVGAHGSPEHSAADLGIAFPDTSFYGKAKAVTLTSKQLRTAKDWTLPENFCLDACELFASQVQVNINAKTKENATFQLLVRRKGDETDVYFDEDKNLQNGFQGSAKLTTGKSSFIFLLAAEQNKGSPLHGYLRQVATSIELAANGNINLYFGRATYNQAYPTAFRQALEKQRLVWPDYELSWRAAKSPKDFVAQHDTLGKFFTDVALFAMAREKIDLVLFYQPLIDSLGHGYENRLPNPFEPAARDDVTAAYVDAYKRVDHNLHRLFSAADAPSLIMLVGDHGMDAVRKSVNLRPLLLQEAENIEPVLSGNLLLLYPTSARNKADAAAARFVDRLGALNFANSSVLGRAYKRQDFTADSWQYGEAIWAVTAASGILFTFDFASQDLLSDDHYINGGHGQSADMPSMATSFMLHAPHLKPRQLGQVNLIDAAPTFSELFGIAKPKDCLGKSLLPSIGH